MIYLHTTICLTESVTSSSERLGNAKQSNWHKSEQRKIEVATVQFTLFKLQPWSFRTLVLLNMTTKYVSDKEGHNKGNQQQTHSLDNDESALGQTVETNG